MTRTSRNAACFLTSSVVLGRDVGSAARTIRFNVSPQNGPRSGPYPTVGVGVGARAYKIAFLVHGVPRCARCSFCAPPYWSTLVMGPKRAKRFSHRALRERAEGESVDGDWRGKTASVCTEDCRQGSRGRGIEGSRLVGVGGDWRGVLNSEFRIPNAKCRMQNGG
jgi:hypothetical protein